VKRADVVLLERIRAVLIGREVIFIDEIGQAKERALTIRYQFQITGLRVAVQAKEKMRLLINRANQVRHWRSDTLAEAAFKTLES